jgi:predicted permease
MGEFYRRLRYLLNSRRFDAELQNDLEFHREMAARQGRQTLGDTLRLREQSPEAWGWVWIDRLVQDLRYGGRGLLRSPGFTLAAMLVLAVGIGINVTAFSVFNLMMLKPLPVRDADSLVRLQRHADCCSATEMQYSSLTFYRDHAKTLSAVIGTMGGPPMGLDNDVQPVSNTFVTANYFSQLGESAALGRTLEPGRDDAANAPPVVVLGYGFWQRRFGADPSIVGKSIHLNRKPATVVGVLPYGFGSLEEAHPDVWLPITQQPWFVEGSKALTESTLDQGTVRMWGRLAPGVTAQMAEQELRTLTNDLRRQHPREIWDGEFLKSAPAGHSVVPDRDIYFAAVMVGTLVLLILAVACANLGGLLLARGVTREHEIGIRIAVGASALRIFRQLFTESVLLALLGSAVGQALSYVILRVLLTNLDAPAWMTATPDWRVLLFAVAMSLLTALLFGLTPALQIARQRQRKTVARQVLVGAQVAASCILLIVAGLLVHAVQRTLHTNPGFGYEQVVLVDLNLKNHGYSEPAAQDFLSQMVSRLEAVPGVTSVGLSSMPPLGHGRISTIGTEIAGRQVEIYPFQVDPAFFKTMSIPLLQGRNLLRGEVNSIIVCDSFARRQWPGEDPLGKQLPNGTGNDTVIGVVGSARMIALNDGSALETYHAAQLPDMPNMLVLIRTAGVPENLPPAVKAIAEQVDPKLFPDIRVLKGAFRQEMVGVQRAATMVGLLGIAAILLAGVGVVGLVAYAVSQRTKEIAIRVALGARRAQVLAAVLRPFSWPVAIGVVAGVGGAVALSSLLTKALYGLGYLDPLSYVGAIATLTVIIVIAMLLPARRALHLDLAKTLHCE